MSHGKKIYLKGTASVKIGTKETSFSAEQKLGEAKGHKFNMGNSDDAVKDIVNEINVDIASAWKKAKQAGDAPEIKNTDLELSTFSAK